MIILTDKELETKIKSIFSSVKCIYISRRDHCVSITLENRYCDFDSLFELSKLLETTNINIDQDEKISDGCPTCGHGESWERNISCSNVPLEYIPEEKVVKKITKPTLSKAQRKEYKKLAK